MQEYHYSARFYDPILSPLMRPIRDRILAIVKRNRYRHILDVCCGTGAQLKMLKASGFEGIGVDLSSAMLREARKGPDAADCREGDATDMNFSDRSFDLVTTTFALHEKSRKSAERIVEEMVRLTMEGGDLIIVDYEIGTQSPLFYKALIYLIEWIAGGEHYRHFVDYVHFGGLATLLAQSDLEEIHRYTFGGGTVVLLHLRKGGQRD